MAVTLPYMLRSRGSMPDFHNPHSYAIHLLGPDGTTVTIPSKTTINLPEYYDRYVKAGQITRISMPVYRVRPGIQVKSSIQAQEMGRKQQIIDEARRITQLKSQQLRSSVNGVNNNQIVGKPVNTDATDALRRTVSRCQFPISNGIGVGILSYNRVGTLRRLVESITRYTDLNRTTVFISDDGSTDQATRSYLDDLSKRLDLVVLRNQTRIGVAGNSNRLLRCLSRFEHMLLLNDDVEVLSSGWDTFYRDVTIRTSLPHLIHQQEGVYGGKHGNVIDMGGVSLHIIHDKPQGAILSLTKQALDKMGYMDERFGLYGMEHVDWSMRASELVAQPAGFNEVSGSSKYFRVYSEASAVQGRGDLLEQSRKAFEGRRPVAASPTTASAVPSVTYVLPFRNTERSGAIRTVVNNIRAQRWPEIRIILVEQDSKSEIRVSDFFPVEHILVPATNTLFNKSLAFNRGVSLSDGVVILHDADTMAQGDYTTTVMEIMSDARACHIGSRVVYADQVSSTNVINFGSVGNGTECDRVVGYYEGGSLACTTEAYWGAGGFNEDFWGYGCEDCDFYYRISRNGGWRSIRTHDLLHLWHGRSQGWQTHHDSNKRLETALRAMPLEVYLTQQRSRVAHYLGR